MSLALKKALTIDNIQARFRRSGIWPLNFEAIYENMDPNEGFFYLEMLLKLYKRKRMLLK